MNSPVQTQQVRELTIISPETFTHLGGRQARDTLTRRLLVRNESTVLFQASLPADTDVPPHGLPAGKFAMLTLISGQLEIALGAEFEASKLNVLSVGSMALFHPGDPQHFARTGPDGAEILVVAFHPDATTDDFQKLVDAA